MTDERLSPVCAARMTRRGVLGFGLAFGFAGCTTAGFPAARVGDDRISGALGLRLDEELSRCAAYGFCGTALVVVGEQIVLRKGYGAAQVERGVVNRADTRFEMNSITKMFTAAAILQLAAAGRIDLDAPIDRYLGSFPASKQGATVTHLANHTAGLVVAGTDLPGDTRAAFVDAVRQSPRESAPGEAYRYTNAGYSLLAAIIEVASGERYEDYVRRHLFVPAGMSTAIFRDRVPIDDARFAHGYVGTPAALLPGPPNPYIWGSRGAGGVWCTVQDVHRWLVAVQGDALLPPAQRAMLFSPPRPPSEEAFGWHVETAPDDRPRISKGGGSDDFASQLLYYPRENVTIIWASNNLRQRWRRTLNRVLPDIAFGGAGGGLPSVRALPDAALAACSGEFAADAGRLTLGRGNGFLFALGNALGVPTNVMFFPQSATNFTGFDPASGGRTTLAFGVDLASLTITLSGGNSFELRRVALATE